MHPPISLFSRRNAKMIKKYFSVTDIMCPRSAVCGADEERVVIFYRQVVDRVPAQAAARSQLLGLVLLPGQVGDLQSRPGAADNAGPDSQAAGFHPALPLHIQGMLRRTRERTYRGRLSGIGRQQKTDRRRKKREYKEAACSGRNTGCASPERGCFFLSLGCLCRFLG